MTGGKRNEGRENIMARATGAAVPLLCQAGAYRTYGHPSVPPRDYHARRLRVTATTQGKGGPSSTTTAVAATAGCDTVLRAVRLGRAISSPRQYALLWSSVLRAENVGRPMPVGLTVEVV